MIGARTVAWMIGGAICVSFIGFAAPSIAAVVADELGFNGLQAFVLTALLGVLVCLGAVLGLDYDRSWDRLNRGGDQPKNRA